MIGLSTTWKVFPDGSLGRAVRIGVLSAAVIVAPTVTSATESVTMMEAGPIRDRCIAAKFSLQKAWTYAAAKDATYWSALHDGQSHVTQAYTLSLSAPWPAELSSTRTALNTSLVSAIGALSKIDRPKAKVSTSRSVLDDQIARMDKDAQFLQAVVPSSYYQPAPTPPDPDPAPEPTPAPAPADGLPVLAAGTGFTGPTAEPAPIGTGTGSDARAIARWDTVPYQTVTGRLPVGVVAFHMAGIDRVEFSLNGGTPTTVTSMTQNPVTGIWEYAVNVDAAGLASGDAEVRAVVYPKAGSPRVLAGPHDASQASLVSGQYSLLLTADAKGTLPAPVRWVSPAGDDLAGDGTSAKPYATIRRAASDLPVADGATIYLTAGDHAYPSMSPAPTTSKRWLTISAAPGLSNDKVRIVSASGSAGLGTKLVRLRTLTVAGVELPDSSGETFSRIWAEGCVLHGKDPLDATRFFPLGKWTGGVFVTECTIRNVKYPAYGHMLTRNTLIDGVGGDAFREPSGLVANCEVRTIVHLDDTHNDVVQFWDPQPRTGYENIIFYGMKAVENIDAQALFVQQPGATVRYDNFAFVNYLTYATIGGQWQNPGSHLLLWNSGILSPESALSVNKGGFMFVDLGTRPTSVHNVSVRNSVFQRLNVLQTGAEPSRTDTSWAENNHYVDVVSHLALSPGAGATTGGTLSSLVADAVGGDFAPAAGSPLLARVLKLLAPADIGLRTRKAPDAVGAVTPAATTQ